MIQFNAAWMAAIVNVQEATATTAGPTAQGVNPVGMPVATEGEAGTQQPLGAPQGGATQPPPLSSTWLWLPMLAIVLMLFFSSMSGRKEKKRRAALMESLKKHDKVLMAGGAIGTIAELNDREVVVRMEEGRVRYLRSAVQEVLTSAKGGSKESTLTETKEPAKVGV